MAELKHTCANDDGLRDVGQAPEPCLACDVAAVRERLGAFHEAKRALPTLDRIEAALAQLESERDEAETVLNRLCETLENNEDCAATAMAAMRQLAAGESPPACLTMRDELKLAREALADKGHLERGAALLSSDQCLMLEGWPEHHDWLEAERARKGAKT